METKTSTGELNSAVDHEDIEAKIAQLYQDQLPGEASNATTHTAIIVDNEPHSPSDHDRGTKCRRCAWDPTNANAVLEKALRKANTAIFLDKNMNREDAKERYESACKLLRQVYIHDSSEDNRRRLKRIRARYSVRITELAALIPDQSRSSTVQS